MTVKRVYSLLVPIALISLTVLSACNSIPETSDSSEVLVVPQFESTSFSTGDPLDPFFQQFLGIWQSPCLFEPTHLNGPGTGDYVVYELSFTDSQTRWAYQDYLDDSCTEEWPYGSGYVVMNFRFSERVTTESGLEAAVFPRGGGISFVQETTSDPTPNDDSSGASSASTLSSTATLLDIIHLSSNGDLFLGEFTSASTDEIPPGKLNMDQPWSYLGMALAPLD